MTAATQKPVALVAGMRKGSVPRELRERQLIDVAEKVFADFGYQATSLEEVARQAGVTRQFLYKLFGGKEELYVACHSRAREQLQEMLLEAGQQISESSSQEDLRAVVSACAGAYFKFVERHGAGWDVLFGSGTALAGPSAAEVLRLRFQTVDLLVALIRRGAPHLDPQTAEAFGHATSGAAEQLAKWWRQRPDLTREQVTATFTDFAWLGISQVVAD